MSQRMKPVEPPFSEEIAALLAPYPRQDNYLLSLFRVFANSERFLKKGTLNLLDRDSPLPLRERELVILRVCANNQCEYEWGVHVSIFGKHAGFDEEQIVATTLPMTEATCWNEKETVLLQAVDELMDGGRLQQSREAFECLWSIEQQLEIMALCGNYQTISFVANTADLKLENFGERFPGG